MGGSHAANGHEVYVVSGQCICVLPDRSAGAAQMIKWAFKQALFSIQILPHHRDLISLSIPGCALHSVNGATDP